jgi:hypothetical protein
MLQDINGKILSKPYSKSKIETHWSNFLRYEREKSLSDLTKTSLTELIKIKKAEPKPYIDSAILISELLTEFGKNNQFHRRFNEIFPDLTSGSILGMQLYILLIDDTALWTFVKSKKTDHLYSNSSYFIEK